MIRLAASIALAALCSWGGASYASDWPAKPVRIVVPFPAGGATDVPARMLGERLSKLWQQPVVVENRPGAGGAIAAAEVARAAPDGYTLLFPSGSVMTVNQFVYPKLPYDPENGFAPVTNVVSSPQVLVVPEASPFKDIESLLTEARRRPGKLTFAHAGVGSQSHLANEYFLHEARIEAVGVPYKGDPPAIADIIGGNIDFALMSLGPSLPQIVGGKLRALGVTSKAELSQLPGVRPIGKTLPGFENSGWFGIVAPAEVPREVVEKISRDARRILQETAFRERLATLGFSVVANSPDEMAKDMVVERERWRRLIKERRIGQTQ